VRVAGRLTIIGGGVMGLMTAYCAAQQGTVYDIGRFTPAWFAGGAAGEPLAGGTAS
jgi:glycine/D-amino acid oxidase-like deaminating enzyme